MTPEEAVALQKLRNFDDENIGLYLAMREDGKSYREALERLHEAEEELKRKMAEDEDLNEALEEVQDETKFVELTLDAAYKSYCKYSRNSTARILGEAFEAMGMDSDKEDHATMTSTKQPLGTEPQSSPYVPRTELQVLSPAGASLVISLSHRTFYN